MSIWCCKILSYVTKHMHIHFQFHLHPLQSLLTVAATISLQLYASVFLSSHQISLSLLPSRRCFPTCLPPTWLTFFHSDITASLHCHLFFFSSFFLFVLLSLVPHSILQLWLPPTLLYSLKVHKKQSNLGDLKKEKKTRDDSILCQYVIIVSDRKSGRQNESGGKSMKERGEVKGESRWWWWNDSLANVRILFAWMCFGWWGETCRFTETLSRPLVVQRGTLKLYALICCQWVEFRSIWLVSHSSQRQLYFTAKRGQGFMQYLLSKL